MLDSLKPKTLDEIILELRKHRDIELSFQELAKLLLSFQARLEGAAERSDNQEKTIESLAARLMTLESVMVQRGQRDPRVVNLPPKADQYT